MSKAEIIAALGDITLRVNGDLKIQCSATRLFDLFNYWFANQGAITPAGCLPIPLWRPCTFGRVITPNGLMSEQQLMGYGTADVNSVSLQIYVASIAALVSVEVAVEVEEAVRPLGRHLVITPLSRSFASTGQQDITDLNYGDNDKGILAMHIGESTGDIDKVTLNVEFAGGIKKTIFEELTMENLTVLSRMAGRTIQTDNYTVDFTLMNDSDAFLASGPIRAMSVKPTWETAGGAPSTFITMVEEIAGLMKAAL
jgi:hypothetical protein